MTGVVRTVPYTGLHPRQPYRAALLHTNGGGTDNGSLYGWWAGIAKAGSHIGAQYQVPNSGRWECYVNPKWVVYHAYAASEWAFGIETEDDGHPETPWNDNQLQAIHEILTVNGVPGRLLTTPDPAHGVGYHQQFAAWNQDGHACPGTTRRIQLVNEIIPALNGATMPITDADADLIARKVLTANLGHSGPNVAVALQSGYTNSVNLLAQVAALKDVIAQVAQGGQVVDYEQVEAAARRAVRAVLISVGG